MLSSLQLNLNLVSWRRHTKPPPPAALPVCGTIVAASTSTSIGSSKSGPGRQLSKCKECFQNQQVQRAQHMCNEEDDASVSSGACVCYIGLRAAVRVRMTARDTRPTVTAHPPSACMPTWHKMFKPQTKTDRNILKGETVTSFQTQDSLQVAYQSASRRASAAFLLS